MRITGPGIWGEPVDRTEALKTLRRAVQLGVNFIDTADSYGPGVSETLIREALYPYEGLCVATKAGLARPGPDQWRPNGDPEYLVRQAHISRERLGVETIDLWQLHRIDPQVPRDEQFAAARELMDTQVIRHVGLSQVVIEEIEAARKFVPISTVQNRYNLADRSSALTIDHCERHSIGFIPWHPLGNGLPARQQHGLEAIAARHEVSVEAVTLAWLLQRSPVMLPIPGTSKRLHLEQNVRAASVRLTEEDIATLDGIGSHEK